MMEEREMKNKFIFKLVLAGIVAIPFALVGSDALALCGKPGKGDVHFFVMERRKKMKCPARVKPNNKGVSTVVKSANNAAADAFDEAPASENSWTLNFITKMKNKGRGFEVRVRIEDITGGVRQHVASDSVMLQDSKNPNLIHSLHLEGESYQVGHRYHFYVLDSANRPLADGKFTLGGKTVRYSGKVDFTK